MRIWIVVLILALGSLQSALWLGERSLPDVWQRQAELEALREKADKLEARNRRLRAEVKDLRAEGEAIVERAREDLGMIAEDEIFIRMVRPRPQAKGQETLSGESGPPGATGRE